MKILLRLLSLFVFATATLAADPVSWREIWDGDKRDWWDKSIPELRKLVDEKNPFATLILADKLIFTDRAHALKLRQQAVDYGVPQAMVWLAEDEETPPSQRLSLLTRAAELGYPRAQTEMARIAFKRNIRPDYDKALSLLRSAADKGETEALANLARLYSAGVGEPRSESEKPINLFRAAYERGDESVEEDLEARVRTGIGTEIDLLECAYFYHRGRKRRLQNFKPSPAMERMNIRQDPLAMVSLKRQSDIRHDPNRTTIEHLDALFEKAFMRQDNTALLELAKLHETGTHGKVNLPRAYAMLTIANVADAAAKAKTLTADDAKALKRELRWMRLSPAR
jgi:TPR repeat protein